MADTLLCQCVTQDDVLVMEGTGACSQNLSVVVRIGFGSESDRVGLSVVAERILTWASKSGRETFVGRDVQQGIKRKGLAATEVYAGLSELQAVGLIQELPASSRKGRGRHGGPVYALLNSGGTSLSILGEASNSGGNPEAILGETRNCGGSSPVIVGEAVSGLEWLGLSPEEDDPDFSGWWAASDLSDLAKINGFQVGMDGNGVPAIYFPGTPHADLRQYAGDLLDEAALYLAKHWPLALAA